MSSQGAVDLDRLREGMGREETRVDQATAAPIAAMSATLDREDPEPANGTIVPPLWHWLYFLPLAPMSDVGPDGHPKRGGFLPPVPLPRRMFAGGRFEFHHPLKIGETITRTTRITDVRGKAGRSGTLVFVTVRHDLANDGGVALSEEHDIVYRENPRADAPVPKQTPAPAGESFSREIEPDPVLPFRYSALTFNSHRIHY